MAAVFGARTLPYRNTAELYAVSDASGFTMFCTRPPWSTIPETDLAALMFRRKQSPGLFLFRHDPPPAICYRFRYDD